jgi:Rrf2 family protein
MLVFEEFEIMKLTRASSYAIHAVAFMAQVKEKDKPIASHTIAKERGIPERFLLKVLKPLVSEGVLKSNKGPNGGYRMSKKAEDVSLLDIVQAVDGPIRGQAPLSEENKKNPLDTKLQSVCNLAAESLKAALKKVKVSELIKR